MNPGSKVKCPVWAYNFLMSRAGGPFYGLIIGISILVPSGNSKIAFSVEAGILGARDYKYFFFSS